MSAMCDRLRAVLVAAGAFTSLAGSAAAQTQPFVFTVTTLPANSADDRWAVRYEGGYGEHASEPMGFDGLTQRLSVQGSLPHGVTLLGQIGLGLGHDGAGGTSTSQELEVLKDLTRARQAVGLTVGLGMRHEWEGTTVMLGRVSAGHDFGGALLFGNVRFERPFGTGRDSIDLITTLGYMHRIGRALHLGVEALGEDLEGFWEEEEAEGGAKLFVGPSMRVAPSGAAWSVSLAGGPIVHATRSGRTSPAVRPLAATDNGYTLRLSFGCSF
jgi:hypothetical protein